MSAKGGVDADFVELPETEGGEEAEEPVEQPRSRKRKVEESDSSEFAPSDSDDDQEEEDEDEEEDGNTLSLDVKPHPNLTPSQIRQNRVATPSSLNNDQDSGWSPG